MKLWRKRPDDSINRIYQKYLKRSKWHYFFAWYPVCVKGRYHWLELVMRRMHYWDHDYYCEFFREYELLVDATKGKCTTCAFNNGKYDNCTVGSYYAEQGLDRFCYEGELWKESD